MKIKQFSMGKINEEHGKFPFYYVEGGKKLLPEEGLTFFWILLKPSKTWQICQCPSHECRSEWGKRGISCHFSQICM